MEGFNCKGFYSFPNADSSSGGTVPLPLLSLLKEQCNSTRNWVEGNKEGVVQEISSQRKI